MRVLRELSASMVRSTGLFRLRGSVDRSSKYLLCKVGDSMELLTEEEYNELDQKVESLVVAPGVCPDSDGNLSTSGGVFPVVSEGSDHFVVMGSDGDTITVLKPRVLMPPRAPIAPIAPAVASKAPAPLYPLIRWYSPGQINEPPYRGMRVAIWRKALDLSPKNAQGKVQACRVLQKYKSLNNK